MEDTRLSPLRIIGETALRRVMPTIESHLRYLDHIESRGGHLSVWPVSATSKKWKRGTQ